jgi:hypothetical protein
MNNLEPPIEPMTVCKILIPTIVLAITFLIPRWYWVAYDHQQSAKEYKQAKEHAATQVSRSPSNLQANGNSNYSENKPDETPWYDKPRVIAVITVVYCILAYLQWMAIYNQGRIMLRQSYLMRRSVAIAQQQLIATSRPWLSAELLVSGPITFDAAGVHVRYAVKSTNYGHSPAMNVIIRAQTVNEQIMGASIEQRLFKENECPIGWSFGETVFPEKDFIQAFSIALANDELDKPLIGFPKGMLCLRIIGSVGYTISPTSTKIQKTFFNYDVLRTTSEGRRESVVKGIDVPASQVVFIRNSFIGTSAS